MKNPSNHTAASAGFRAADATGIPVPSRFQIIDFIGSRHEPLDIDEIARNFELKGQNSIQALSSRINRLCAANLLKLTGSGKYLVVDNDGLVLGKVSGHVDGYGFVIADSGDDDLYLNKHQMRKVLHGDRVLSRVRRTDHKGRKEGEIVEVLVDQGRKIVGKIEITRGAGTVVPDDPRYARNISVDMAQTNGAKSGDFVLVRISGHPVEQGRASGKVVEIIGTHEDSGIKSEIAVRKHELPHTWPKEVESQARKISGKNPEPVVSKYRRDLTDLPLLTIDGIDARDFDDAVYCEKTPGGWRLLVAIADVSHYVTVDSPLDMEAYNRGTSVYFPDRVIPMLPEQLSNDICSLIPDENRNCLVCEMQVDSGGLVTQHTFFQGVMRSRARLTYEIVDKIVTSKDVNHRAAWSTVTSHLDNLCDLTKKLRESREANGSIDFNFPEPLVQFDAHKRISSITARERTDAHRLIEECMLAANVCAARFLQAKLGEQAIYRNHQGPDSEGLATMRKFLSGLGLSMGGGNSPSAADYRNLLDKVENRPDISSVVQTVLLRSLSQAVYSPEQLGHFALAFSVYTHFTSPIRRYSDLVVHRLIKSLIGLESYAQPGPAGRTPGEIGEQCSFTERRADEAAYDVLGWLKAEFMSDKIGESFAGVISGVREFGVFVQLQDIFVDGLIHVTNLGNDYYQFDAVYHKLQGERSGKVYRLGDRVEVVVAGVNMQESKIDFELANLPVDQSRRTPGKKQNRARKSRSRKRR